MSHKLQRKLFALALYLSTCAVSGSGVYSQQNFPSPPTDEKSIYLLNPQDSLQALAFETATSKLELQKIARSDRKGQLTFNGETSRTNVIDSTPRFYLFVRETEHPPLLVRLVRKHTTRTLNALMQRGYSGLVVPTEEIIKPHYRVLKKSEGKMYMEVSPREPLEAGEYAFIGNDLSRIFTFQYSPTGK